MSRLVVKPTMWFPYRSDTNRPLQSQKRARSLKFRILVNENLYYPSSKNKGADQLRSYCEADLRLCFSPRQIVGFPTRRLNDTITRNLQTLQLSNVSVNELDQDFLSSC